MVPTVDKYTNQALRLGVVGHHRPATSYKFDIRIEALNT